jgi:hypothetical protein
VFGVKGGGGGGRGWLGVWARGAEGRRVNE